MKNYTTVREWVEMTRRGAGVTRCHTVKTIMNQSVGEHTFNVMMILLALVPQGYRDHLNVLLQMAAYHDLPEQATGDVPAPAKWNDAVLDARLKELEADFMRGWDLTFDYVHEADVWLLKFADRMELMMYAREELMLGNLHIQNVWERCVTSLHVHMDNADKDWVFFMNCVHLLADEQAEGEKYVKHDNAA